MKRTWELIIIIILFAITVQHKIQDKIPRDGQGTTKARSVAPHLGYTIKLIEI